ncbi:alpha/beta fold hydrolase [Lunatibacter salilacus]|uniref:alpha/beta fold hydrolase n=1 Tax=Lunatibacter salilacus TaxID=2483804 RepID=UPI00131B639D|nr:alpha/beta hydrolase [Lunatibacter salilacus]
MPAYYSNGPIKFHYSDQGKGNPLVFLHGLGADLNQSREMIQKVTGYRKITLDFRGHGKTIRFITDGDASMAVFSQDLFQLLQYLKVEYCTLGGISLGAAVAMKFTLQYPDLVERLVLVRPAWLNEKDSEHFRLLKLAHDYIQKYGVVTGKEYFEENPEFIEAKKLFPEYTSSLLGHFSRSQGSTAYSLLKHLPEDVPFAEMEDLVQIKIPTLVVGTAQDPLHPLAYAEKIAEFITLSQLEILPSKYLHPKEHLKQCQNKIAGFLVK